MNHVDYKDRQTCPGCGGGLPTGDRGGRPRSGSGPVAACDQRYRELLKRERSDLRCMAVHALSVDAYAVQHPGTASDETARAVGTHLVSLYAQLLLELPYRAATRFRDQVEASIDFRWLEPPNSLGELTVLHPLGAESAAEHIRRVNEWAWSCWRAWTPHHGQVMSWARRVHGEIPRPRSRQLEGVGWLAGARNLIMPLPESAQSSD